MKTRNETKTRKQKTIENEKEKIRNVQEKVTKLHNENAIVVVNVPVMRIENVTSYCGGYYIREERMTMFTQIVKPQVRYRLFKKRKLKRKSALKVKTVLL